MKIEVCCEKLMELMKMGELYIGEDGELHWDNLGEDIFYCPFCGELLENELVVKKKV
jgi:hypothetical protein